MKRTKDINFKKQIVLEQIPVIMAVLLFILCLSGSANAVQPSNPIRTKVVVEGTEVWNNDIVFADSGSVEIRGDLTIKGVDISFTNYLADEDDLGIFFAGTGAFLTFVDSSIDMSGISETIFTIHAMGASVTLDNCEIHGGNSNFQQILSGRNKSSLFLKNGTRICDNQNKSAGWIIRVSDGTSLEIEHSIISRNEIAYTDDSTQGIILGTNGAKISVVDSRFENNRTRGSGVIAGFNGSAVTIEKSVFSENVSKAESFSSRFGGAAIRSEEAVVVIGDENIFRDNSGKSGGAVKLFNSEFTIGNGNVFEKNTTYGEGGAVYFEDDSNEKTVRIGNDNRFIENESDAGGALAIRNASLEIGSGNEFSGNVARLDGGAFFLNGNILHVGASTFSRNTVTDIGSLGGGAISQFVAAVSGGETVIDGAVFRENSSFAYEGGAVLITTFKDLDEHKVLVKDASFINNQTVFQGSALVIGHIPEIEDDYADSGPISAEIIDCEFINNNIPEASDELLVYDDEFPCYFGGTITIGPHTTASMSGVSVIGNSSAAQGAGIVSFPGSELFIKPRSGAALFGNTAAGESVDIYITDDSISHEISEKAFNGGYHHWSKKNGISYVDMNGNTVQGSYWRSSLSDPDLSGASSKVENNSTDSNLYFTIGAAIANHGKLTIGQQFCL